MPLYLWVAKGVLLNVVWRGRVGGSGIMALLPIRKLPVFPVKRPGRMSVNKGGRISVANSPGSNHVDSHRKRGTIRAHAQ